MITLHTLLNQPWAARLGWTLVHFFWQGTVIAALYAALRGAGGRHVAPRARYWAACCALAAMTAAPVLTFVAMEAPGAGGPVITAGRFAAGEWERLLPWLVPAWIAGVVVFSMRLLAGWRWTRRLRRAGAGSAPGEWQRAVEELTRRMRVTAPVRLIESSLATAPAVVGWLRPLILVPAEALASLPVEQVRALVAHELAHIRRHDYLVNILQSVVETVLFYHPGVWWVSAQVRAEREMCCDDLAVAATGDALIYATALADLDTRRRMRVAAALAAGGGSLVNRIRRLVGDTPEPHNLPGPGVAWALSLLWLAGVGAAAMHSAPSASGPSAIAAHRLFVAPSTSEPAPVRLDLPPRAKSTPLAPVLSALLFDPLFGSPQAPAPPAAGARGSQAVLEGVVINTVDGTPLAGARVRMTWPYGFGWAPFGNEGESVYTRTDAQGHFKFAASAAGVYGVAADQPGFLMAQDTRNAYDPVWLVDLAAPGAGSTSAVPAGAYDIPGVGKIVKSVDADGLIHGVLTIELKPYAAITGKVTEPNGGPRAGAPVKILVKKGDDFATITTVQADDRGEYRIAPLAPGTYYVMADKTGGWRMLQNRLRATFYPDAADASAATPLALAAGQEARADIRLLRAGGVVRVAGTLTPADSEGSQTRVLLYQPGIAGSPGGSIGDVRDGRFVFRNILPGQYTLVALARAPRTDAWVGTPLRAAIRQVEIGEQDMDGLAVELAPLRDLTGTVTFGAGCRPAPVHIVAAGSNALGASQAAVAAGDDGSFTLSGLVPALHNLRVAIRPGYTVSAMLGERDAGKGGFFYPTAEGEQLRITVSCAQTGREQ